MSTKQHDPEAQRQVDLTLALRKKFRREIRKALALGATHTAVSVALADMLLGTRCDLHKKPINPDTAEALLKEILQRIDAVLLDQKRGVKHG